MSVVLPPETPEPPPPRKPCRVFRAETESLPCEACGFAFADHPRRSTAPTPAEPVETTFDYETAYRRDDETTALFREPWRGLPSLDAVLAAMPPPGERLATGIPTLDRHSRGGFVCGRVYTIVGPPGFGKTALWQQLALRWAREYDALSIGLFCDEGSWQAAVMMAEGLGFDRDEVEDSFAVVHPQFYEATRNLRLRLPKPDDPETMLDSIEKWVPADCPGPVVVVADSAQTVRCQKGLDASTPKEQVEALMKTARHIARVRNAIVLATSKANRSSYASKNPQERILGLAAGRDSGDIEFDSDALFTLDGDVETGVTLTIQKNRPGDGRRGIAVKLGFDRARATFREIDQDAAEAEAETAEREQTAAAWSADEKRVLRVVRENPGRSARMLRELVKVRRDRLAAVLEELARKGKLQHTKTGWITLSSDPRDEEEE